MSQHKQTAPSTFGRAVGILIGLLLLLFIYYYIRYDTFPKDFYTGRGVGRAAGFGLLLTVGVLWAGSEIGDETDQNDKFPTWVA